MDLQEFESSRTPPSWNWPKFQEERRNRYFLRLGWCCRSPHLTSGRAVTQAGTAKAVWREQWERNHTEQSIFSDIVMWLRWGGGGGWKRGVLFPAPVTFERHPAAFSWKQLWTCSAPLGARSGLSDILSLCHSGAFLGFFFSLSLDVSGRGSHDEGVTVATLFAD